MRTTTSRLRRLVLVGLAAVMFSGAAALPAAGDDDRTHGDEVEAASLTRASESLPGSDTPIPAAAGVLLIGSAGLAWVVRRSAPVSHA